MLDILFIFSVHDLDNTMCLDFGANNFEICSPSSAIYAFISKKIIYIYIYA